MPMDTDGVVKFSAIEIFALDSHPLTLSVTFNAYVPAASIVIVEELCPD